ncbi:protein FREE1-like isoform X2 [Gastrolobium bilobum]|uniref:protein FREE1-like isoform X2 n=1 Tax=Gastrolobium bilobum TaxID=150636 RepID=UPI002AB0C988|nr:protein FREE1-like isoform X2 [Gastrolobium bilobum]
MQQGEYSSAPYYQFPHLQNPIPNSNPNSNPSSNPTDPPPNLYASAPPFSFGYSHSDYTPYTPEPPSPTAPSYPPTSNTNFPSFNSSSQATPFPPFESHISYQQQSYYPPYDQHQAVPIYAPPPYSGSSVPPHLTSFDHGGAYSDDGYGSLNRSHSDSYENRRDEDYGEGVFAYEGGKVEPYGARDTDPKSSSWSGFDDYGRSIGFPSDSGKIVKAVPKVDGTKEDAYSGVQKFRVKLLVETGGQSAMDVLCQIGFDGIRLLDPNTSRTLRIYPLENITSCERFDSSTFAFWSKSSVDIEPRQIRLQSNSYTTNTLLDTVTAATIQFKEMGGNGRSAESLKTNEQPTEKKKGFGDWMNLIKPANEEKDHWVPDEAVSKCTACGTDFGAFVRRHHCRNCGDIFCDKCTNSRIPLTADENAPPVRVCDRCMAEVTQRLSSARESSSKPVLQRHEDLARKLQELERNRKTSGSKSDGSGRQMKEVACPICTVHLQVQVPSSGSETIECGVCQHPFLVSAH